MINSPTEKIIEAEKVVSSALRLLGFQGSFTEQWKAAEQSIGKNESVWKAHKLRNRIVHEVGISASDADADFVMHAYEKAVQSIIR